MSTDVLGRRRAPRITEVYGACRCCERLFVDKGKPITDTDTQTRHDKDGHCGACRRAVQRYGKCSHEFPASSYRDRFTTEQNARHLARFLHTIQGTSRRTTP